MSLTLTWNLVEYPRDSAVIYSPPLNQFIPVDRIFPLLQLFRPSKKLKRTFGVISGKERLDSLHALRFRPDGPP